MRDLDSLKCKFDKLANMKKPTGDPSCPEDVRRAKHIARDIFNRANAGKVGSSSEDDEDSDDDDKVFSQSQSQPALEPASNAISEFLTKNDGVAGTNPLKRKKISYVGQRNKRQRNDGEKSSVVGCMADSIEKLAEAFC